MELINKEYVESSDTIGKMCMPEQNQDSIKVAITATKKIRDKIKVTDISAVADLQQAGKPGYKSGYGSYYRYLFCTGGISQ